MPSETSSFSGGKKMDAEQKKAVARLKKMKVYKLIQVDPKPLKGKEIE